MAPATRNNKKKKQGKKTVKIQFISCINADDPSLATPVTNITEIKRSVWEDAKELDKNSSNMNETMRLLQDNMDKSIHQIGRERPMLKCRECSKLSTAFVSDKHMYFTMDYVVKKPFVATVKKCIMIPICSTDSACHKDARARRDTFRMRNHVGIGAQINTGLEDEFAAAASGDGNTTGQEPTMIYSCHLNADLPDKARVVHAPFFGPVPSPWWSQPLKIRQALVAKLERESIDSAICNQQEPLVVCRECNQPAKDLVCCPETVMPVECKAVYVSRDIAIPVCSAAEDSRCRVRAQQKVEHYWKKTIGEKIANATPRKCNFCGIGEGEVSSKGGAAALFMQCSRCKVMVYCSTECQRKSWNEGHKKACQQWNLD